MIVVDANILCALLLPTQRRPAVRTLYRHDRAWVAPHHVHVEYAHAFVRAARAGRISRRRTRRHVLFNRGIVVDPPVPTDLAAVIDLALDENCGAYDAQYVWLARRLGLPLLTYDGPVLRNFPGVATTPEDYLAARGISP